MAKKQKPIDTSAMEAEMRFMGTYGDAITLLMCFFVLLYAMSQVDVTKFQLLVSGLADPFDNTSIEEGLLESGTGVVGAGFTDPTAGAGVEAVELVESPGEAPGEIEDADERLLANDEELREVQRQIVEALAAHGLDASVSQHLDSRGLAVSIATDDVLFASGSPTLSPEGAEIIASLTPILDGFDNLILLEGHTDTVPLDQNGYTNWNLSADRALAVLEILDDAGLKPGRLSATGYGEHRPISGNDTEEGRAANRRVEIVIVAETPGITEN